MVAAANTDNHMAVMSLELTEEEERALVALLRETLDYARYPLAPRLDPLKSILAKMAPALPKPAPAKPLTPAMAPSVGRRGRR